MARTKSPRELAARALCSKYGHPENIMFEGAPLWQSYLPEVDTILKAIQWPGLAEQKEKDQIDFDRMKSSRRPTSGVKIQT